MRNVLWVVALSSILGACGCGKGPPGSGDGGSADSGNGGGDAGNKDGGKADGSSGGDGGGGNDGGGGGDAGCTNDPGCTAAGQTVCDPAGTNKLGTCVQVGACLKVQNLAACPSTLQTCAAGASACACPAGKCSDGQKQCGATGIETCVPDVAGGCGTYGADTSCPARQACSGSAGSAACSCVADPLCTSANPVCDASGNAVSCAQDANGCFYQASSQACVSPLFCAGGSCGCPANTSPDFYADPVGGSDVGAAPHPTGLQNPPACRYKKLGDALAAANGRAATGASARAIATGGSSAAPAVFSGEALPLPVGAAVSLTTSDSPPAPGNYVVELDDPTAASGMQVREGGSASGYIVRARNVATGHDGIVASCVTTGNVDLSALRVEAAAPAGGGRLARGIRTSGGCTISISSSTVKSAEIGIEIAGAPLAATTTLLSNTLDANDLGLLVSTGSVEVRNSSVKQSIGVGIQIAPAGADVAVDLGGGDVTGSGKEGLLVLAGTGATAASVLTGNLTEFKSNGSASGAAGEFPAIRVAARTASFSAINVHDNGSTGVLASGAGTSVSLLSSSVSSNNGKVLAGHGAVALDGASLNVQYADLSRNTGSGAQFGPTALGGVIQGCTVERNGSHGIDLQGGTLKISGATPVRFNGGSGVSVIGGSLDSSANIFDSNGVSGAQVASPGVAAFHGGSLSANAEQGISVSSGSATLDGGATVNNNAKNGLEQTGGQVVVASAGSGTEVVFQGNHASGVRITLGGPGSFDASQPRVALNRLHGIEIDDGLVGSPITLSGAMFTDNVASAVFVSRAGKLPGGGASLIVSGSTMSGGAHGLYLEGSAGDIAAHVNGNTFTNATDTAVVMNGSAGSSFTFQSNVVTFNSGTATWGTNHKIGGVLFKGTPPGTLSFVGNTIHHNARDQVGVVGAAGTTWDLSGAGSCGNPNIISCYDRSPTGGFLGLIVVSGSVTAHAVSWQVPTPNSTAYADFGNETGATVDGSGYCGASPIACP